MSRFNLAGILIGAAIAGTGLFLLSEAGQRFRGAVTYRLLMAAVTLIVTARGLTATAARIRNRLRGAPPLPQRVPAVPVTDDEKFKAIVRSFYSTGPRA